MPSDIIPQLHAPDGSATADIQPLLIDFSTLSRWTNLRRRTLYRLDATRDIPGRVLFQLDEIRK